MSEIRKINTSNFRIDRNIISFNDFLISMNSISQIDVAPMLKRKVSVWAGIVFLSGLSLIGLSKAANVAGAMLIAGVMGYVLWVVWENAKRDKCLNISLNSGDVYCISCKSNYFQMEVMGIIEYCMNDQYDQRIQIDFVNCRMANAPILPVMP